MADKDEFKFDDDDAFPDTDLGDAFAEGEQAVPTEPDYPMTIKKSGGSRMRLILLLLLVVLAGGGGAYYFLVMNEPPPPPKPPAKKAVAAKPAPKPAPAPVAPAPAAPAGGTSTASAPPPAKPGGAAAPPPPKPAPAGATTAAPAKPATAPAPAVAAAPAPAPAKPAPAPVPAPAPAKPSVQTAAPAVTDGPWKVEAGTYLNAAALKAAEKKIRSLGYEPQVSTTKQTVRMTRLRLGTFPESEVKEALAYARGIAPDAFSIRSAGGYTIYAGTYTNPQNIRQMTERLVSEGVPVEQEPYEAKRTISLVRFGGFADQKAAADAAAKARKAGIAAEVVNPR